MKIKANKVSCIKCNKTWSVQAYRVTNLLDQVMGRRYEPNHLPKHKCKQGGGDKDGIRK